MPDTKLPEVDKHVDESGREMFVIYDQRYLSIVRKPEHANRAGYMGTESWVPFDEVALRDQLTTAFRLDDQQIAALMQQARTRYVPPR